MGGTRQLLPDGGKSAPAEALKMARHFPLSY
jgi:hypothetical protein